MQSVRVTTSYTDWLTTDMHCGELDRLVLNTHSRETVHAARVGGLQFAKFQLVRCELKLRSATGRVIIAMYGSARRWDDRLADDERWAAVDVGSGRQGPPRRHRHRQAERERERERELRRVVGSLELVDVAPRVVYVFLAYCVHEKARKHHVDNLPHTHTHTHTSLLTRGK